MTRNIEFIADHWFRAWLISEAMGHAHYRPYIDINTQKVVEISLSKQIVTHTICLSRSWTGGPSPKLVIMACPLAHQIPPKHIHRSWNFYPFLLSTVTPKKPT